MKRIKRVLITAVIAVTGLGFAPAGHLWQKMAHLPSDARISSLYIDPQNPSQVHLATSEYYFIVENKQVVQSSGFQGNFMAVNDLHVSQAAGGSIALATDKGLFESTDKSKSWHRIFTSSDEKERVCRVVLRSQDLYVGTDQGLFVRGQGEKQFQKISGELARERIEDIAEVDRWLFVAAAGSVYRLEKDTRQYQKVFSLQFSEEPENEEIPDPSIKQIVVSATAPQHVYIGTMKGIYVSDDLGGHWRDLVVHQVPFHELKAFLIKENNDTGHGRCNEDPLFCVEVYIATHRGAFLYQQGRVTPLYQGLETNEIDQLALSGQGEVIAATKTGLYALRLEEPLPDLFDGMSYESARENFKHEPRINDVHRMAIHYAEVDSKKIADWRKLARLKAIVPSLSAGVGRSATERYHWDTGQTPDKLIEGRDFLDWDLSVSWDLSDLVWSADQTTIDGRSKLMVELREDILDQITRLYFERRRLQVELLGNNSSNYDQFDKQMRVEELTALIDAYTGGGFSRKIAESRQTSVVRQQTAVGSL